MIVGEVNSAINDAVPPEIADTINGLMRDLKGLAFFNSNLALDFSFTTNPDISDSTMALYLNGTIFNNSRGYDIPTSEVTDVAIDKQSQGQVQMALSHYTADSFLLTLFEAQLLEMLLTNDTLGELPIPLTTTYLDGLLPGLVSVYGDN